MPERERIARLLKDIYAKWAWAGSNTPESVWNLMTDALLADRGQPAPQLIALKAMLERLGQVHEIEGLMVEPLNLVDDLLADRAGADLRAQLAQCIADGQRMAGQLEAAETRAEELELECSHEAAERERAESTITAAEARAEALERDGAGCGCKTDAQTGTRNGYMCEWHREKYLALAGLAALLQAEAPRDA